jgi:serine/threonine protein kinase
MAPEQVEHPQRVDHRADIYSLGVVFYEMLTGELPLGKFAPPSRKVQVDVRLDEVVLHALEKEPERRYQQASALKTDVETIATSAASGSKQAAGPEHKPDGREKASRALTQYNPWELTVTFLGSLFFVVMILTSPAFPRPFALPLRVISLVGLGICGLTWAGLWPFPSPFFPEPNFSSRNLRRGRATARVALAGLLVLAVPLVSILLYLAGQQVPELQGELVRTANTSGFGPVIERTLDVDTRRSTAYLNLDTGQF